MDFAQLALVCLVAILGPLLSFTRGIHIPVVIGEIAVGLLLGTSGFGVLNPSDPAFTFLAGIGFVLVMFVAGSDIPTSKDFWGRGVGTPVVRAGLIAAIAIPIALLIATGFGTDNTPLYVVLIASSSASIILPSLSKAPLHGRTMSNMIPQIAIADTACIIALPLVLDREHVGHAALGTLLVIAGAVVSYYILRWLERTGLRRIVHDVSGERGLALELRVLLVLIFSLAALARIMRVSTMLSGFVLGIAVAEVGEPRRVAKQFFALSEGFFAPVFFVWIGAQIDLRALAGNPWAILLGIALAAGALFAHGAMALTGQPTAVAFTTAAQMGVPIAAIAMTEGTGVLAPGENAAILLAALITVGTTALLSGRVKMIAAHDTGGTEAKKT